MTTVILAEKPDQAKKYAKALGQAKWDNDCWRVTNSTFGELVIVSSVGHIVHMENPLKQYENWNLNNLPVFPKEFNYRISSGKRKVFSTIKREVDRADTVIFTCLSKGV